MKLAFSDVASTIGIVINGIVLIFLALQLRLVRQQVDQAREAYLEDKERARKQSTLEFTAATLERRHALTGRIPSEDDHAAVDSLVRSFDHDEKVRRRLYDYLNYYEMLATGVNTGVLDQTVVNRNSGGAIIRIYATYSDLIERLREEQSRPTLYEELELLAKSLADLRGTRVSDYGAPARPVTAESQIAPATSAGPGPA